MVQKLVGLKTGTIAIESFISLGFKLIDNSKKLAAAEAPSFVIFFELEKSYTCILT